MEEENFHIAAVERDTGISRELLRAWERRYGFPTPSRDEHGERCFPGTQVARLRLIKRLLDLGHRPGKLIAASDSEIALLATSTLNNNSENAALDHLLATLRHHDSAHFQSCLQQHLGREGLQGFILNTLAPLAQRVGDAWAQGQLAIFEEHLFAELSQRVLRQAISALPSNAKAPRILLTTPPNEQHLLGLLMAEALWTIDGANCLSLGTQMPLGEITQAAASHGSDIVAIALSSAFSNRQAAPLIRELRQRLPEQVALWVGGAVILNPDGINGVRLLPTLADAQNALNDWYRQTSTAGQH